MLLTDEQYVIKWLSQYGPLPKAQVVRLLRDKSPTTAERLLNRNEAGPAYRRCGGRLLPGPGSLLHPRPAGHPGGVGAAAIHRPRGAPGPLPGHLPSQLFFLKENTGYEIVVLYEGEQHLPRLLQHREEDLKYIFVLPKIQMVHQLVLPRAPCLFSTVEFQGQEEPQVHFFAEEVSGNGTA